MKKIILVYSCLCLTSLIWAQNPNSFPAVDDEFVGPFPSWINVKTYGAAGDGVTDETAAIQAAFDAIGNDSSTASVVFLPPGIYRIEGKLRINFKKNVSIIGADPASTIIKWAGEKDGIMMEVNGTAYSRFNRITWDGSNLAYAAIDQSWDGTQDDFDTGNEYAENIFVNVGIGIQGGSLGNGFAETSIMRCKFIQNSVAGISLGNYNALDIWVWNSVFEHCAIGVTNVYGAGNFKVYNSLFKNSMISDISIGNTGEFSFRDNTSINSEAFLTTDFSANPAMIIIQGNKIIDPIKDVAIEIRNQGPITFIDNTIRSRVSAIAPVVIHELFPNSDFFSIGNTYTVDNALQVEGLVFDDTVVAPGSLGNITLPFIPDVQPNLKRRVFEVPQGSDATAIQQIIDEAAKLVGTRPVIHLPYEAYTISSTLTIPAGSDMQIVGDGDGDVHATVLNWSGTTEGPVIEIFGPSKATFRDISINGNGIATNILATNIDQRGARVFMHELEAHSSNTNLLVNGLDHTQVLAINSSFSNSSEKSISVIGGPQAVDGTPKEGRTIVYAGAESDNQLSHEVTKGGNLLVRDVWYESNQNGQYLNLPQSGIFSVEGCHMSSPETLPIPQMSLTNFSGKATFLSSDISNQIVVSGDGSLTQLLGLSILSEQNSYITNEASPSANIRSFNARGRDPNSDVSGSGSYSLKDLGDPEKSFLKTMLSSIRNVHAPILTALPEAVSDLRFYRIWTSNSLKGMELQGLENGNTLPINFLSLSSSCQDRSAILNWKTEGDGNSKKIDIERSDNGTNWKIIGSVSAKIGDKIEKYSYRDSSYNSTTHFYRIVETDINSNRVISSVVKSSCFTIDPFAVYPNPASGFVKVSISTPSATQVKIMLLDSKGALIKVTERDLYAGINQVEINVQNLPEENYVLRAVWGSNVRTIKVLKK